MSCTDDSEAQPKDEAKIPEARRIRCYSGYRYDPGAIRRIRHKIAGRRLQASPLTHDEARDLLQQLEYLGDVVTGQARTVDDLVEHVEALEARLTDDRK